MRTRLVIASLLAGSLALMTAGADAATKTMDGRKIKKLTITASGGVQDNDPWLVTDAIAQVDPGAASGLPAQLQRPGLGCKMPACARIDFVYKPAKGIKGGLMMTAAWTNPASDIDLYAAEKQKDGTWTEVAHCASTGTASEKVYLAPADLRPGRTYALVAQFFRSLNETVTGTVEINVPSTIKSTASLPGVGDALGVNCVF